MMSIYPPLAALEARRKEVGISVREMLKGTTTTASTYSRWLNGHHEPRPSKVSACKAALETLIQHKLANLKAIQEAQRSRLEKVLAADAEYADSLDKIRHTPQG